MGAFSGLVADADMGSWVGSVLVIVGPGPPVMEASLASVGGGIAEMGKRVGSVLESFLGASDPEGPEMDDFPTALRTPREISPSVG